MKNLSTIGLILLMGSGCATVGDGDKTAKGGAIGTLAGAAAGAIWGNARGNAAEGALIGALAGGAIGGLTGAAMDKQEEKLRKAGIATERDKNGNLIVKMSGETLKFDSGKATLKPEGTAMLDKIAEVISKYSENRLGVEGHTDNTGGKASNLALSQSRADAVTGYLVSKGLPARCVLASIGYGEDRPVADNATPQGRALNRRVELKIGMDKDEAEKNEKERELYKNSKKKYGRIRKRFTGEFLGASELYA
jgi:outer membrane protein OmpA-like peptidoglycan-associated protein